MLLSKNTCKRRKFVRIVNSMEDKPNPHFEEFVSQTIHIVWDTNLWKWKFTRQWYTQTFCKQTSNMSQKTRIRKQTCPKGIKNSWIFTQLKFLLKISWRLCLFRGISGMKFGLSHVSDTPTWACLGNSEIYHFRFKLQLWILVS